MPIEIKELHIRINVKEGGAAGSSVSPSSDGGENVVSECVEQVLETIKKQKER